MTTPRKPGRPAGPPTTHTAFRLTAEDLSRLEEMRAAWHLPDRTTTLRQAIALAWMVRSDKKGER
jgi:hypothetical protein